MGPARRAFSINRNKIKLRMDLPACDFRNFKRSLSEFPQFNIFGRNFTLWKHITVKFDNIVKYYEDFSGLKELKHIQEKVEEAGEKLTLIQDERRNAFNTLLEIKSNLKNVHSQLELTKKGDGRYIHLITEEYDLLKKEEMQQEKFREIERNERDQFILFSNLVKASHEKEKAQAQKTKYWSIIGSLVGTMVGFIASTVNGFKKESQLKRLIAESSNSKLEAQLNKFLETYIKAENLSNISSDDYNTIKNKIMNDILNDNTANNDSKMQKYLDDILKKTKDILKSLEETVKVMQAMSQFEIYSLRFTNEPATNLLIMNLETFKQAIHHENQNMKNFLWKTCLAIIVASVFLRVFN